MLKCFRLVVMCLSILAAPVFAEKVELLYKNHCASCHGDSLAGGLGPALNDSKWKYGDSEGEIDSIIRNGIPKTSMPAFSSTLSASESRALTIFIKEQVYGVAEKQNHSEAHLTDMFSAAGHKFTLQKVFDVSGKVWAVDVLPNGDILATEVRGRLWLYSHGKQKLIKGTPSVWSRGQGGLLDVKIAPDYSASGWIYLSYSEPRNNKSMTRIVRGKIRDGRWVEQEAIFTADPEFYTDSQYHFGSRMVFSGDYLYFSVGERADKDQAQELSSPKGKIHRLYADGGIPKDNPWSKQIKGLDSVWSYGHRNPQGLTIHPTTGAIWEAEHGPRGGDEINLIEKGQNYGWPVITYGMNYDGTPMTDKTAAEGMKQPIYYWVPSIAVANIHFYYGPHFPKWQGKLLVGSLAKQELRLLSFGPSGQVLNDDLIFKGLGRIRDLMVDQQGVPYLVLNSGSRGAVYRMHEWATGSDIK